MRKLFSIVLISSVFIANSAILSLPVLAYEKNSVNFEQVRTGIISDNSGATFNKTNPSSEEIKSLSPDSSITKKENLSEPKKKLGTDLLKLIDNSFLLPNQNRAQVVSQMKALKQFIAREDSVKTIDRRLANQAHNDLVYVYVSLKATTQTSVIDSVVWKVTDRDEKNHLAVALVEVDKLEALASLSEVSSIRSVMPPVTRSGSVVTEGDIIHQTDDVRSIYSQSGAGIKIGVISNGVDNIASSQSTGDLPAGVTVLSNSVGGDEGTAMLEIIYDMVPDTSLYFHDSGNNVIAFNSAIDDLVVAGVNVIVDDIGWIREPFFEDGTIASHVASVLTTQNIVYVSAAGNDGSAGYGNGHYQGEYYNNGSNYHDFSRGSDPTYKNLYVNVSPGKDVIVVLQWNDNFGSSGNDYDLYMDNADGSGLLASSVIIQDGDDNPLEWFPYTNTTGSAIDTRIWVNNFLGLAATKTLELFIYPSPSTFVYSNNLTSVDSIFGHPAVPGVIATGAIAADDPGNDTIEPFSSQGPVTIIGQGQRAKPDITGIDKVTVTGVGGFGSPFPGTSAAAPHIAAIAAQLWGQYPSATGNQIRDHLLNSAVDLGATGTDTIFGYGRADALLAFQAGPTITSFNFESLTPTVIGTINNTNHTIALTVPYGTDVTALVPTIVITGVSVNPASGVDQNFTNPVTYTVTTASGLAQAYIATVTVADNPDIAAVAADKAALVDDSIKGGNPDLSNITTALTNPLPASGSNGSTITWVSDRPGVISNDGQTVVRPAFELGNDTVTLTATLTKGVTSDTKAFTLTVLKLPASTVATITSAAYTVSAGGTVAENITNVPFGTSKADFLAVLTKDEAHQTWDDTGITDSVVTGNTLIVTAQDGLTTVTYTVTVNPVLDTTVPVIDSFIIPETSSSLIVPISSFVAHDNVGVTGYMLTETSDTPLASDPSWLATVPSDYTFSAEGVKTLYAWAKDAAGNISLSLNDSVTITLPVVNNPPSFDPIADQLVNENAPLQSISITNVSPGPSDESGQTVTMSTTSSDPSIVPNPVVSGSGATRTLTYTPEANVNGTVTITVIADDGQAENNTYSRTFSITINAVSHVATVTAATYTVSAGGTASETIANVPFGTSKATFLAALTKGESNQIWNDTSIADPVVTGNTLVVTAQDGLTTVAYTITVNPPPDTTAPVITAPADQTFEATGPETTPTLVAATAIDNIDPSPVISYAPHVFLVGTTIVTWTATDASGNSSTTTSNVTIQDTTPPAIASHDDVTVEADSSIGAVVNYDLPIATDLVDGSVAVICVPPSGTVFPLGDTLITCTSTDTHSNPATSNFTVHVIDTTTPTITAPADINQEANGILSTVDLGTATATDTIDPNPIIVNDAPATFPLGTTIVTWTATDASGNYASATQNVVIVDTILPVVDVNTPASPTNNPSITFTITDETLITTECKVNDGEFASCVSPFEPTLDSGTYTVTVRATDAAGNIGSGVTDSFIVDINAPTINITGPDAISNNINPSFTFDSPEGGVNFECKLDSSEFISCTSPVSYEGISEGSHEFVVRATDEAGNIGMKSHNFIIDLTPPIIALHDDILSIATSASGAVVNYTAPDATDTVDGTFSATCSLVSGSTFPLGTTLVTCNASDVAGNAATETSFNITVEDETPPVITLIGDATINLAIGQTYTELGATAIDNVDGDVTSHIVITGSVDTAIAGTYYINYNVSDVAGNNAEQKTRTVIVSALQIASEEKINISTNNVTIQWTTSHLATSRVLYDTISHPDPITGTTPNYGYANSTTEVITMVTDHSVIVSGLSAGTTYYMRPVSHGSPEMLGNEIAITTNAQSSGGGGGGGGGGGSGTVTPTTTKKGDINGDNKVDKYDFSLMMANWGKTGTNGSDLNNDKKVDKYDFALLMANWETA